MVRYISDIRNAHYLLANTHHVIHALSNDNEINPVNILDVTPGDLEPVPS